MSNNPYEILHLEEDATYDQIKQRYRHLTRSLHPDKQPLENYQATKRLFERIDEAYKSISSPLRRHLFRHFGLPALKILEEVPEPFEEYDVEYLSEEQISRLRQLMTYLLYEREASFQTDKTKFITKMVVNISKTLKGRPKNAKRHSKRNYHLPEIQNCTFEYEMVLPELLGFTNTFALSQTTSNMKADPKAVMTFSVSMARRLFWNYMAIIQLNMSSQESSGGVSFNRLCENNLTIGFTPISFTNWRLNAPKISIEKSFHDYQISSSLDLAGGISIEYSDSTQKKWGKSLKLYMEKGSLGVIPRLEVEVTEDLRMFVQVSAGVEAAKDGINLRPSLTYGYRLAVSNQLKVELASCLGAPNYLQLSFISSKFRVGIPLITAEVDLVQFQLVKVAAMLLTFAAVQGFKFKLRRQARARQRLLKENESRLNELKRDNNRRLSDVQLPSQLKRELETKYNGLIVVRAIFGEQGKVAKIAKILRKLTHSFKGSDSSHLQRKLADLEEDILGLALPVGGIADQAEDVTALLQSEVVGGQLLNYDLSQFRKYSPTIDPTALPVMFILYVERGNLHNTLTKCQGSISLGAKASEVRKSLKRLVAGLLEWIL